MPSRNEKMVLSYLCKVCTGKRSYLVSPYDVAKATSKKAVLSVAEIDEIMTQLSMQNYLDFVASQGKQGYCYCVTLKKKGLSYLADSKRQRKAFGLLILRTFFLAVLSFVFGVILRAIFKS